MRSPAANPERVRLDDCALENVPWKKWGPYLSERQWGTVREDYSDNGDAWDYFPHDQARSRAYRWGEDGIAGYSDDKQRLCFCLSLWNGNDPILKERLFGLTNSEGNHGEDVKEYYYYLDSSPTHSFMKYLYKYPQAAYPYDLIVKTNRERSRKEREYELIDTRVFDDDRYFDVFVDFAKSSPEDTLIQITAWNRGPDAATLHVLPQLWFRNTWSWRQGSAKPTLAASGPHTEYASVAAHHPEIGERFFFCEGQPELLFTENETNSERLFHKPNSSPYVKDAFHNYLIAGNRAAVNPTQTGTKFAAHYTLNVPAHRKQVIRLRLLDAASLAAIRTQPFGEAYKNIFSLRQNETDTFFDSLMPPAAGEDERRVIRQAIAGMLWSKQYYYFDLDEWLREHGWVPGRPNSRNSLRNANWFHMINDDVISMPDKWEYPWYAAWDLAFHTIALNFADPYFAKDQLLLMMKEVYLHPNGQIPAYEWNFGDVNPPVHAFAAMYTYQTDEIFHGKGDFEFLQGVFQKLLLNFSWWANRKDPEGRNLFEGGFLGLDNIGVFDRSAALPTGGFLEQADGTSWMALFCQNMLAIALELAQEDPGYEELAMKFVEHFFWIAGAMDRVGENADELWDQEDGFFYDVLHLPDGSAQRLKVRSMVGLLPLCAVALIPGEQAERFKRLGERIAFFRKRRPELIGNIFPPDQPGYAGRRLLAICNEHKLRRILTRMLDEDRFFSKYGVRALSRWHLDHPYEFDVHGEKFIVQYMPAESQNGMFGGNSNWRGPIWVPVNVLIVRALLTYYGYFGDSFKIECPTGSGHMMNLFEVATEISRRLAGIFLRDASGKRPVFGDAEKFQNDPHWRDYIYFYEYFHGDNGEGLGASHQTGWTGLAARFVQALHVDPQQTLQSGVRLVPKQEAAKSRIVGQ